MLRSRASPSAEAIAEPLESLRPSEGAENPSSSLIRLPDRGSRYMETLRHYIETVRSMTGARTSSLLIDPVSRRGFGPLLLSTGDPKRIPGFATEEAALETTAKLVQAGRDIPIAPAAKAVRYYPGVADDTHLFRISMSDTSSLTTQPHSPGFSVERRRHAPANGAGRPEGVVWIGLGYDEGETPGFFSESPGRRRSPGSGAPLSVPEWLTHVLVSGVSMAWQVHELSALLKDPITGLPRRSELQVQINNSLMAASQGHGSFALALINPFEFEQVNQRLGRADGDLVLREIGNLLQESVRKPDSVYHYGGAVFAAHFCLADEPEASKAADRLQKALCDHKFQKGAVRLDFSIGVACYGSHALRGAQVDSAEMLRRADSALNAAKASGGAQTMVWSPQGFTNTSGSSDRLSGIFTADTRKDYRNMLLLWDTVQVISSHAETAAIANEFVDRVNRTFKPNRAALVSVGNDGRPRLLSATPSMSRPPCAEAAGDVALLLSDDQRRLLARAEQTRETQSARVVAPGGGNSARQPLTAYAVPLPGGDKSRRCLYVDGPAESFRLDSSDLVFLTVLAKQVAVALDRSELALRWKREKERESHRLRAEVRELRQALQHSRLVYQSSRMEAVLDTVRKVAPTDATVLITGESGTGKEMVARFLHEQSGRRKKESFATVDCGAIAQSLIETELFGHAKGAYTGASGASKGRIVQAEGGTLFLDEIGELPLDVQAKLLRFVQEREITPVGATRSRKIDARIVAATNRDLAAEVEAGRFRQDLYYRLQVVSVTVPPLRQRPEDILPLAQYFLETFAAQYEKPVRYFSAEAEGALLECPWPGNVRELQNRLLQAVIMSGRQELSRSDLRLDGERGEDQRRQAPATPISTGRHEIEPMPSRPGAPPTVLGSPDDEPERARDSDCDPWDALRRALARQVEEALQHNNGARLPLGVWLTEDLVLSADETYGGVARQASGDIGMAETTFRRHLEKIKGTARAGMSPRSPQWSSAKLAIQKLIRSADRNRDDNLVLRARHLLLAQVISCVPRDDSLGSVLMGVTKPTYRRWKAEMSHSATGQS